MDYLIVDGYNVINAWQDVFDVGREPLEDLRDKLADMLSNYQGFKKLNIIVVFDAHLVKGSREKREKRDNIEVVFTKENETADIYIERFVYKMSGDNTIRVVTSDYLEQRMVLTGGGVRMTPRELKEEMDQASRTAQTSTETGKSRSISLSDRVNPDQLERLEKMRRGKVRVKLL